MWHIVKGEFLYHRLLFAISLVLTPFIIAYELTGLEDAPGVGLFMWLLMFLTVNTWVSMQAKEKRDIMYVQLPLPVWQVGLARLMVVTMTCLGISTLCAALHLAAVRTVPLALKPFLTATTAILFLYSLVFIVRDHVIGNKHLRDAKLWVLLGLGLMAVGNVYLLLVTKKAAYAGEAPPFFLRAVGYLFVHHPFSTPAKTVFSVTLTLALAVLSTSTFTRRKTHV